MGNIKGLPLALNSIAALLIGGGVYTNSEAINAWVPEIFGSLSTLLGLPVEEAS
jgi:hypothetical protein